MWWMNYHADFFTAAASGIDVVVVRGGTYHFPRISPPPPPPTTIIIIIISLNNVRRFLGGTKN